MRCGWRFTYFASIHILYHFLNIGDLVRISNLAITTIASMTNLIYYLRSKIPTRPTLVFVISLFPNSYEREVLWIVFILWTLVILLNLYRRFLLSKICILRILRLMLIIGPITFCILFVDKLQKNNYFSIIFQ